MMNDLFQIMLSFPTALFSVLMVIVLLYWGLVILGALDLDILDFGGDADGALDGAADGALDGAADGALDGAADGALDGAADGIDGAMDGAADGADGALDGSADGIDGTVESGGHDAHAHHTGTGGLASIFSALRLRSAPLTIIASLIIIYSWILCLVGSKYAGPVLGFLPGWLFNILLVTVAMILALLMTSVSSRPLGRLFITHQAPARQTLVGKVCMISTGRVDESFGQANYDDGGAGMLLQVRCDTPGALKRGDQALIIDFSHDKDAFLVEPYASLLPGESKRIDSSS